jgi:hypothetical protein
MKAKSKSGKSVVDAAGVTPVPPAGRTAPSLKEAPPFTRAQKDEVLLLVFSILSAAHGIVEAAIEDRAISAHDVESYYGTWTELLCTVDGGYYQGSLLRGDLFDDIEARCFPGVKIKGGPE